MVLACLRLLPPACLTKEVRTGAISNPFTLNRPPPCRHSPTAENGNATKLSGGKHQRSSCSWSFIRLPFLCLTIRRLNHRRARDSGTLAPEFERLVDIYVFRAVFTERVLIAAVS